jgi:hypothetical protein
MRIILLLLGCLAACTLRRIRPEARITSYELTARMQMAASDVMDVSKETIVTCVSPPARSASGGASSASGGGPSST